MRVQVYEEELGEGVDLIEETSRDGKKFYGLRVWLKSAFELHHTTEDDDRSAVTFWSSDRARLHDLIADMREAWIGSPDATKEPAP